MLQESTSQAKTGNILGQTRREIVIPVSQIKRKMPELGLAHQDQPAATGAPNIAPAPEVGGG